VDVSVILPPEEPLGLDSGSDDEFGCGFG
jgi:hypothetical protein